MLPKSLVLMDLCEGQEVFRNPFPKTQSHTFPRHTVYDLDISVKGKANLLTTQE